MSKFTRIIIASGFALGCHGDLGELLLSFGKHHRDPQPEQPPRGLDPECSEIFESRARVIREAFAACETDDDCTIIDGPGCLSGFLCTSAIARGSEGDYLRSAQIEIDDYIQECGNFCSIADCAGPTELRAVCDTATHVCAAMND